jgi:hypothetical protein
LSRVFKPWNGAGCLQSAIMSKPTGTWFLVILLLAVFLRAGVALTLGDTVPVGKDENSYSILAARLAAGHGYSFDRPWYPFGAPAGTPTAHWSFLYTAFVAAVYRAAGGPAVSPHPLAVRLLQAVLAGLLLPWLTYRLARRGNFRRLAGWQVGRLAGWQVGRLAGWQVGRLEPQNVGTCELANLRTCEPATGSPVPLIAAFLAAIYAYFIIYGAMVQTEAFYICALLWSLERALALAESLTPDTGLLPSPSATASALRRCCASRSCRGSSCCSPGCCGRATAAATCALPSAQP